MLMEEFNERDAEGDQSRAGRQLRLGAPSFHPSLWVSYFVIPNLYSVDRQDKDEQVRALAMNQLAGVLNDLNLVRALSRAEHKRFGRDEMRDRWRLAAFRQRRLKARDNGREAVWWRRGQSQNPAGNATPAKGAATPLRNHGLLSKAQRALEIGGWSAAALGDPEIYRLVDPEGLTPYSPCLLKRKRAAR